VCSPYGQPPHRPIMQAACSLMREGVAAATPKRQANISISYGCDPYCFPMRVMVFRPSAHCRPPPPPPHRPAADRLGPDGSHGPHGLKGPYGRMGPMGPPEQLYASGAPGTIIWPFWPIRPTETIIRPGTIMWAIMWPPSVVGGVYVLPFFEEDLECASQSKTSLKHQTPTI